MGSKKVILVGLDGATWDLIIPWANTGKLATFKKLMQYGVWSELESTAPPISPSAWTSIYTGVNPGKHGIDNFFKTRKDSYFYAPISSRDRKAKAIWEILSEHGMRSIVINAPFTYPPDEIVGIMVSGFGTPSIRSNFTFPAAYKKTLLEKFPDFTGDFGDEALILGAREEVIVKIRDAFTTQMEVSKCLLTQEPYDLFVTVFRAHEPLQHYYWEDKDLLLTFYQAVDSFLEYLLEEIITEDTVLIIVSDHGFQGVSTYIRINNWLEQLGLLCINESFRGRIGILERLSRVVLRLGLEGMLRTVFSGRFGGRISRWIPSSSFGYISDIDWDNTKAFYVDGSEGLIRINLKGRESKGAVDDGEYEEVRQFIIREALKLVEPSSERGVISAAAKKEEVFVGDLGNTSDIVLFPEKGTCLAGGYDYLGNVFDYQRAEERPGEHDRRGIFLCYGRDLNNVVVDGAQVCDIVPTVLAVLGLPMSEVMDGQILGMVSHIGLTLSAHGSGCQTAEKERVRKILTKLRNSQKA